MKPSRNRIVPKALLSVLLSLVATLSSFAARAQNVPGTCAGILSDEQAREAFSSLQPELAQSLLRYLFELRRRVEPFIHQPNGEIFRQRPQLPEQIALVQYFDTFLVPILERYKSTAAIRANDPELHDLANEEIQAMLTQVEEHKDLLLERVANLLVPAAETNSVILEISRAEDTRMDPWSIEQLIRMYQNVARLKNWNLEVLDESFEGLEHRSLTMRVTGPDAYRILQFESGTHRLIITGKSSGAGALNRKRTHTNIVAVHIYPEPKPMEFAFDLTQVEITTFRRASGPGGQHVNTTDSGVRVVHRPTGMTVVISNDRSQHSNKERALRVLKARLFKRQLEEETERRRQIRRAGLQAIAPDERYVRTYDWRYNVSELNALLNGALEAGATERLRAQLLQELNYILAHPETI